MPCFQVPFPVEVGAAVAPLFDVLSGRGGRRSGLHGITGAGSSETHGELLGLPDVQVYGFDCGDYFCQQEEEERHMRTDPC